MRTNSTGEFLQGIEVKHHQDINLFNLHFRENIIISQVVVKEDKFQLLIPLI